MDFLHFLFTMAFALAGGAVAQRCRLPSGALLGAIAGVAVANLLLVPTHYYAEARFALQILSGVMVGSRIGREELREMRSIVLSTLLLLAGMLLMNLTFGGLIYRFSALDLPTALFATTPGGVTDMALVAAELGANATYVGILQLARLLIIFSLLPPIFRRILKRERGAELRPADREPLREQTGWRDSLLPFLRLLGVAAVGGLLLRWTGLPAGALVGALLFSAGVSVWKGKTPFPDRLKFFMKVFSGAYIGIGVTRESVSTMSELLIPLLIMTGGIFVFTLAIAFLMHRATGLDLAVCLLSSTPGGVQEMALLADDMGADTPKIAAMHSVRLIFVITIFPTMIRFLALLFG